MIEMQRRPVTDDLSAGPAGLPAGWTVADKGLSEAIHREAYGRAWEAVFRHRLRPVGLDDTVRFACLRCGHCCHGRAPERLWGGEGERLAAYARQHGLAPPAVRPGGLYVPAESGGACRWLGRANGQAVCGVHAVKPHLCRLAPIGVIIDHGRKVVAVAAKSRLRPRTYDVQECLGIEAGGSVIKVADWLIRQRLGAAIADADLDWHTGRLG